MATGNISYCFLYPNNIFLFFITLAPIWFWLEFLLKEDPHPEPRLFIFLAVVLGALSAILSYYVEHKVFLFTNDFNYLYYLLSAFVEEFLKFLIIFIFIFQTRYFDEPIDAMIYMGFSAIGFSFLETFAYLCGAFVELTGFKNIYVDIIGFTNKYVYITALSLLRFLGANFLHLLASVMIGFGYAISIKVRRVFPFVFSFICSSFLHFLYNLFIIKDDIRLYIFPVLWAVFFIILIQFNILKINNDRLGARASD